MNALAICAVIGIVVLCLAWVWVLDWCVVGLVREWHRRKLIRIRLDELKR